MTSTAVPPRPKRMTGPNVGSSATPAISSRALGRLIIGWIVTPSMCASGPRDARALHHLTGRLAHAFQRRHVEHDAADIRLVRDVPREENLHDAGAVFGDDGRRDLCSFVRRPGEPGRRAWNMVGFQNARDVDNVEPAFAARKRIADNRARKFAVGSSAGSPCGVAIKASRLSRHFTRCMKPRMALLA